MSEPESAISPSVLSAWIAAALAFVLLAGPTLAALARVYRTDGNFSHGFLVPLIAGYIAWQVRGRAVAVSAPRPAWSALIPVAVGMLLILFARWYEISLLPRGLNGVFLAALSLVLVMAGIVALLLGWWGLRRLVFPVGFLLLAVPVPSFLLNRLTLPLQRIAAMFATVCMRLAGMTVTREGNILQLPDGALGVAEACSGIRSVVVLLAAALVIAFFNRLRPILLVLLALSVLPIAVLTNAIRVIISAVLYAHGYKDLAHGGPHELLGLITFALGVAMLLGVSALFTRLQHAAEASNTRRSTDADSPPEGESAAAAARLSVTGFLNTRRRAAGTLAFLLGTGFLLSAGMSHHYDALFLKQRESADRRVPLDRFPARIGPYIRVSESQLSEEEEEMLAPSDQFQGAYVGPDGRRFSLTLLYWEPPRGKPSERPDLLRRPHTPDECYPAAGWKRQWDDDRDTVYPWMPGEFGSTRVYRRDDQAQVMLFWLGHAYKRTLAPDQLVSRLKSMVRSWTYAPAANLHTVSITTTTTGDIQEAQDAVKAFAKTVAPILPRHGIGQATRE